MGKGQNEQLFHVAKDAGKLFPAVVAVLALRPVGNTLQKNHESLNTHEYSNNRVFFLTTQQSDCFFTCLRVLHLEPRMKSNHQM